MLAIRHPQKAPLILTNPLRKHLKGIRQSAKTGPKRDPEWIELRNNRSIPSWIVKAERKEKGSKKSTRSITENRSEEHTSELQSRGQLVCRLLLEKKKATHTC